MPDAATLVIAIRDGARFRRLPLSASVPKSVNSGALQYAPCLSDDQLELFFTRMQPGWPAPAILRATRQSTSDPFGAPQQVSAISGFAEAPSLSADGLSLYYHARVDAHFAIYRVTRVK
jgi:hypothetical protein